jgi:hypothetical protein
MRARRTGLIKQIWRLFWGLHRQPPHRSISLVCCRQQGGNPAESVFGESVLRSHRLSPVAGMCRCKDRVGADGQRSAEWLRGNACGCSNPVPAPTTSSEFRPARCLVNWGDSTAPANQYSRRVGNCNHGPPTRTPLSTTAICQQEKTENWTENHWPPTRTLGVSVGPRQSRFQTGENHGAKYLRNVWDNADGRERCCQRKRRGNLGLEGAGSPAWVRTTIHGSKGRCPTIRRPGNLGGRQLSPTVYHA